MRMHNPDEHKKSALRNSYFIKIDSEIKNYRKTPPYTHAQFRMYIKNACVYEFLQLYIFLIPILVYDQLQYE